MADGSKERKVHTMYVAERTVNWKHVVWQRLQTRIDMIRCLQFSCARTTTGCQQACMTYSILVDSQEIRLVQE